MKPLLLTCALLALPSLASAQVERGTLPLKTVRAFENLRFDRAIVVTPAPDEKGLIYVAEQKGRILAFENESDVEETTEILDIRDKVAYADKMNEEGLLGFAFHPKFAENGQFFLYYTLKSPEHTSVVSRFTMGPEMTADPKSEEEILRIPQPFWNHNGGTIAFGNDGYLYIGLGDGGSRNDPEGNAQNLGTWLGSILRIDVDHTANGKAYAIPKDNPFVGTKGAKPEIYAYGLRNVWRMAFDRETGALWAADVGQNLWEEINLVEKGGNYGWDVREAFRPFEDDTAKTGAKFDSPAPAGMIDPVYAYHHEIGKSITGGHVYRGKKFPQLVGKYVYADYVTGLVWALEIDPKTKRAVANHEIASAKLPVMSIGEDTDGELYFMTTFGLLYTIGPAE